MISKTASYKVSHFSYGLSCYFLIKQQKGGCVFKWLLGDQRENKQDSAIYELCTGADTLFQKDG